MKKMAFVGAAVVVIIVIIVIASMAIVNNKNASENSSVENFSCDNPPPAPAMWQNVGNELIANPDYVAWQKKWMAGCMEDDLAKESFRI